MDGKRRAEAEGRKEGGRRVLLHAAGRILKSARVQDVQEARGRRDTETRGEREGKREERGREREREKEKERGRKRSLKASKRR